MSTVQGTPRTPTSLRPHPGLRAPEARIEEHGFIGDCRSGALVTSRGCMDWLCWPRFESPPLFGALLDPSAGHWTVAPAVPCEARPSYLEDTNCHQVLFESSSGQLRLTDWMPVRSEAQKDERLMPDHAVVRRLECLSGELPVDMVFVPRPDFGRAPFTWVRSGARAHRLELRTGLVTLHSDLPLPPPTQEGIRARWILRAGDTRDLVLTFEDDWPGAWLAPGVAVSESLRESLAWWRGWVQPLQYEGVGSALVRRSALALKLLVYAPSGAIVAAPTTSLPERVGGPLNWDYRFCWLRDASLTVRALFGLGFLDEARAFLDWLLHTTRLTHPNLHVLYDVHGNPPPPEQEVPGLTGHRGSLPVRVGNAAMEQLQLDIYGEILDAAGQFVGMGGELDRDTRVLLTGLADYVCSHWEQPDEGIWEPRGPRRHHTHSQLLCWTALDRACSLARAGLLPKLRHDAADHQRAIRSRMEAHAWNPAINSWVSTMDGNEVDASLLLMPWYGFEDARSPRMAGTWKRICSDLGVGRGLLNRYRASPEWREGAFGACSFWAVEFLALGGGTEQEARAWFEQLLERASPVGLFSEEFDPATGESLGNYPQGFTHVALINAALSLSHRGTAAAGPSGPGTRP